MYSSELYTFHNNTYVESTPEESCDYGSGVFVEIPRSTWPSPIASRQPERSGGAGTVFRAFSGRSRKALSIRQAGSAELVPADPIDRRADRVAQNVLSPLDGSRTVAECERMLCESVESMEWVFDDWIGALTATRDFEGAYRLLDALSTSFNGESSVDSEDRADRRKKFAQAWAGVGDKLVSEQGPFDFIDNARLAEAARCYEIAAEAGMGVEPFVENWILALVKTGDAESLQQAFELFVRHVAGSDSRKLNIETSKILATVRGEWEAQYGGSRGPTRVNGGMTPGVDTLLAEHNSLYSRLVANPSSKHLLLSCALSAIQVAVVFIGSVGDKHTGREWLAVGDRLVEKVLRRSPNDSKANFLKGLSLFFGGTTYHHKLVEAADAFKLAHEGDEDDTESVDFLYAYWTASALAVFHEPAGIKPCSIASETKRDLKRSETRRSLLRHPEVHKTGLELIRQLEQLVLSYEMVATEELVSASHRVDRLATGGEESPGSTSLQDQENSARGNCTIQ